MRDAALRQKGDLLGHRRRNRARPPAGRRPAAPASATCSPAKRVISRISPQTGARPSGSRRTVRARLASVWGTILGMPVVPEVVIIQAVSLGAALACPPPITASGQRRARAGRRGRTRSDRNPPPRPVSRTTSGRGRGRDQQQPADMAIQRRQHPDQRARIGRSRPDLRARRAPPPDGPEPGAYRHAPEPARGRDKYARPRRRRTRVTIPCLRPSCSCRRGGTFRRRRRIPQRSADNRRHRQGERVVAQLFLELADEYREAQRIEPGFQKHVSSLQFRRLGAVLGLPDIGKDPADFRAACCPACLLSILLPDKRTQ